MSAQGFFEVHKLRYVGLVQPVIPYASWVNTVVRQVVPYPSALDGRLLLRKDLSGSAYE